MTPYRLSRAELLRRSARAIMLLLARNNAAAAAMLAHVAATNILVILRSDRTICIIVITFYSKIMRYFVAVVA
jgi:hypothetical protein